MPNVFKTLFSLSRYRLSRRIVFLIFVSVIVIETIILIPSYLKRESELLDQLNAIADAKVQMIFDMTPPDATAGDVMRQVLYLLKSEHISGGALYMEDGRRVGHFGETPELMFTDVKVSGVRGFKSPGGDRYDAAWSPADLKRPFVLVLRQDSSAVRMELVRFIWRIAGLVVIISIFVTVGAWIALGPLVITPILRLREDLIKAGEVISHDGQTPKFKSADFNRRDELGDVITAFNQMYHQISDAVNERKKAEAALQKSFKQIEAYSGAMNAELERGRQMQKNFLPGKLLEKPGWEFSAFFMPARQVAGDFYDLFELPNHRIGLVLADVCDKGVGAALFMALFRSLIRIFSGQTALEGLECHLNQHPTDDESIPDTTLNSALRAVQLTNNYIATNHEDLAMFATLFFGVLDPETGALTYISGGHDPLYIMKSSGSIKEYLGPTGPAVGVQADARFETRETRLGAGDILFGYTDGVTEARAPNDEFFKEKRLIAMLNAEVTGAATLLDRIATAVKKHIGRADQFDDITMLAIRRLPS